MNTVEKIKNAGVVGAGGAGFPTHVKVNCKAEYVIANGAECEPLLRVDQLVMSKYAKEIVEAMAVLVEHTGATYGVIGLKKHYHDAISEIEKYTGGKISIQLFDSYYPAGDEQTMVYEVTGRVVPTGGLPLDVGAVVVNVSTLLNISNALNDIPVTDKHVTITGEVENPITVRSPIGYPIRKLIELAGGPVDEKSFTLIIGGPLMGRVSNNWDEAVTKTTGGVIVLKNEHSLLDKKKDDFDRDVKLAKAVCCQCNFCTDLCPRNALGLHVEPHKAMRAVANNDGRLLGQVNGVFSCCNCGLCTLYACNFGLNPSAVINRIKIGLGEEGVKPIKEIHTRVDRSINTKKVPVSRLIARLGLKKYDVETPLVEDGIGAKNVKIPLQMHIGAPSEAVVSVGDRVKKGDIIGAIPKDKLGAVVHSSIDGSVKDVTSDYVEIAL